MQSPDAAHQCSFPAAAAIGIQRDAALHHITHINELAEQRETKVK